jgi:putative oxidoreductase
MTRAEECKSNGYRCCALSIVRFVLGVIFFMHGGQKVMGWFGGGGLSATVQAMSANLPVFLVYLVAFGEFLGGIALIVGFLSRLAAAGIGIIMIGAVVTVHWQNGFFLNWFLTPGKGHGFEYNLALIAMALAVVVGGSGCIALDGFWCRKKERI